MQPWNTRTDHREMMSNSDDGSSKPGESSQPSASETPKKTLRGVGPKPPRLPSNVTKPQSSDLAKKLAKRLGRGPKPAAPPVLPPLPRKPQPQAVASAEQDEPSETVVLVRSEEPVVGQGNEFSEEHTEIAAPLERDDPSEDTGPMSDEMFPDEKTEIGQSPAFAPELDIGSPPMAPDLRLDQVDVDETGPWQKRPEQPVGLAEDSLPEPIRARTPTNEDLPAQSREPVVSTVAGSPNPLGASDSKGGIAAYRGNATVGEIEFQAEKTELLNSPFESDPAVAKLVSLEGPATGQEFFASSLRNTIGRGTNNTIVVPDLAMSRQHFEIIRNPDDSFALLDLQSVNGTTLNGTKVREADLFHGDRVEAGKSQFQFVLSGNLVPQTRQRRVVPAATATVSGQQVPAGPKAPTSGRSQAGPVNRLLLLISVAAVLVSLVLVVAITFLKLKKGDDVPASPDAAAVYMLGVEAVKARNWDQAEGQFQRAQGLDPKLDGVAGQLRRIEVERGASAAMEQASELLERDLHEEAVTRATEIPRDSVYYSEAQELIRNGRKSEIVSLYQEAQEALAEERTDQAERLVAMILRKIPTHQGALTLRKRLEGMDPIEEIEDEPPAEEIAAIQTDTVKVKKVRKTKRKGKDDDDDDWGFELVGSKKSKKSKKSSSSGRVANLTQGFLLYRTRKFDAAQKFFEKAAKAGGPAASSSRKIAVAVGDFKKNYPSGVASFKAERWADAERKLAAAKRADSVVGDYFDKDLKVKLATVEANLGLQQLAKGNAVAARKLHKRGRGYNASDSTLVKLNKELEDEARSIYVKANDVKKTNPAKAAKLCRQIKAIVPSSNPTYKKAAKLLKDL